MTIRGWLAAMCSISLLSAQESAIEPVRPTASVIRRPYLPAVAPPIRAGNSGRMSDLIRAGNLYLTAQDAIALALENNIDIEVARYNPILSTWQLERAQAGGALPGVPSGASQAGSVANGQGVAGSQAAAGVSNFGASSTSAGAGNATISQIGPVTQTLDPSIQEATTFSHTTTPQPNLVQSITPVLITNTRVYNASYQQGFLSGGSVTLNYTNHYLNENAPTDLLNPSSAPNLSVSFQHNLLRGFGVAVNARTITVARINLKTSELNFNTQVINTVVNVLNLYFGLAVDYEDLKAKQAAVDVARQFFENNQRQLEIGSLSPLDVTLAETQLASNENDLVTSRTNLQQQEVQLKNMLSRNGLRDPALASAHIVPLDPIVVPERDDLPPLTDMIQQALANRSDLAAQKANLSAAEISALGTRNGLLPLAQAFGGESQAGLAGTRKTVVQNRIAQTADPYFAGGVMDGLGQVFRRNFPTERVGAFIQVPVGNRQAQADFGIDQLQLRQNQLTTQKNLNQVVVDLSNYTVALRQARARYEAALKNRTLQQQLLAAEREKFDLGASTPYIVIQQQRDLANAQATVISTLVDYRNARLALDLTLGVTLEANHISIEDARAGKVAGPSSVPAALPN